MRGSAKARTPMESRQRPGVAIVEVAVGAAARSGKTASARAAEGSGPTGDVALTIRAAGGSVPASGPRSRAPSRHDLPQAERRRQILVAAMRVIARDGLSATTMEKVAREADVSPGTVLFHFVSKDALLRAALAAVAIEYDAARRAAIAAAGDEPATALDNLILATFDPALAAPEKVALWYAFWGEATARRVYMDQVGDSDRAFLRDVERLFGLLAARPEATPFEPKVAARSFAGLLEWLSQELLIEGSGFDHREAIRIARAHLAGFLERSRS
ncbi:MAG: TetR family transcriptional regulator [Hyphomicrobiaceae bacterium]